MKIKTAMNSSNYKEMTNSAAESLPRPPRATKTVQKPVLKPTRSMTYPAQRQSRPTAAKGTVLDSDELARRLEHHLLEQKAQKERRLARARGTETINETRAGEAHDSHYHAPRIAADDAQNALTVDIETSSTSDIPHQARDKPRYDTGVSTTSMGLGMIDTTTSRRRSIDERNHFRINGQLEGAKRIDEERGVYRPQRRHFGQDPLIHAQNTKQFARPSSTGDAMLWEQAFPLSQAIRAPEQGRRSDFADWEQCDEQSHVHRSFKDYIAPLWRKPEQLKTTTKVDERHEEQQVLTGTGETSTPAKKTGFLGHFRRESRALEHG